MVYITIFTWKRHVLTGSVIRTYDVNIKGYSSVARFFRSNHKKVLFPNAYDILYYLGLRNKTKRLVKFVQIRLYFITNYDICFAINLNAFHARMVGKISIHLFFYLKYLKLTAFINIMGVLIYSLIFVSLYLYVNDCM